MQEVSRELGLEEQVYKLTTENARLRAHIKAVDQMCDAMRDKIQQQEELLSEFRVDILGQLDLKEEPPEEAV